VNAHVANLISKYRSSLNVLCLVTVARSGSKFFHSLLDDHPNVICFPRKLQFSAFWNSVSYRQDDLASIVDTFIDRYDHFFSGECWYKFTRLERTTELGPKRNETFFVDADLFRKNVYQILEDIEIDRATLFLAFHFAYFMAKGNQIPDSFLLFYHVHDAFLEEELEACVEDFPQTRILHTTRHPLQTLDSVFNWMVSQNKLYPRNLYTHYCATINDVSNLLIKFPDTEVKVLTFERLQKNSKEVMKKLCGWIDLEWNDSLLESTIDGKLWWGNGKKARNGFTPDLPDYKLWQHGGLRSNDWNVMNRLIHNRINLYGYYPDYQILKVDGKIQWLRLFWPTATEWMVCKSIVSIAYWIKVSNQVISDINNPIFASYDYYMRRNAIRLDDNTYSLFVKILLTWLRYSRIMASLIKEGNIFTFVYNYVRRVVFCVRLDRKNRFKKLPELL
tara:strand:- start:1249 stop:2589 length:1341 start_codon:yes stop_codon:yes gene_type:complete